MKLLDKKGFTLVEVVATVAIASILMVALVSMFDVVGRIFVTGAVETEERLVVSSVKAYIKNELYYATEISTSGDGTYNELEFADGKVYKNDSLVFDEGFYGNTRIYLQAAGTGPTLSFNIKVVNNDVERSNIYVLKTLNKLDNNISSGTTIIYYK